MDKIPDSTQTVLADVRIKLMEIYGLRLIKFILFGSYARGDFQDGSDINILIVLSKTDTLFNEHDRYFPITSGLSLKYDVVISAMAVDENEYRQKSSPLMLNLRREGVEVF